MQTSLYFIFLTITLAFSSKNKQGGVAILAQTSQGKIKIIIKQLISIFFIDFNDGSGDLSTDLTYCGKNC
ncbi:hypothetical protein SOASR032_03750 [Pragia fontium]|uniref:Uncharacterized protein n=1 Tax=Pragia fontium TaxID=82985 RepID=A0ABQ5LDV3_9GAMM|nr:hypothetical protein SOASR032_03750 [Pragia fontium]